jgi:hypothetical protein
MLRVMCHDQRLAGPQYQFAGVIRLGGKSVDCGSALPACALAETARQIRPEKRISIAGAKASCVPARSEFLKFIVDSVSYSAIALRNKFGSQPFRRDI